MVDIHLAAKVPPIGPPTPNPTAQPTKGAITAPAALYAVVERNVSSDGKNLVYSYKKNKIKK